MVEDFKNQQFTRMWNEESKSKREKFRNLMKSKLDLLHVEVTEENARAFYNGRLESRQPERIYQMPERSDDRRPPRRRRLKSGPPEHIRSTQKKNGKIP